MSRLTIPLRTQRQREHAKRLIDKAPDNFVMRLAEETRSDRQNRALWGKIKDIRSQLPDMQAYSPEDCKLRFMNALGAEMRFLPVLEGQGSFPVGYRSSTLTVEQFGLLLELISEYGARNGVQFSE